MSFQAPIGSTAEIAAGKIWPGRWVDATPYLTPYSYGIHTGADLNLNYPAWDSDAHSDVYAMGEGKVIYSKLYSTQYWGNLIIIDHGTVDGLPLFSRYAHVEKPLIAKGKVVQAGDIIAKVGNGEGLFPYHLHFDISRTDVLVEEPQNWPGSNIQVVRVNYVDPKEWLQNHVAGANIFPVRTVYVIAALGLRVRAAPGTDALPKGSLPYTKMVSLEPNWVNKDGLTWAQIIGGQFDSDWLAVGKEDLSETFVSVNPPGT